METEAENPSGQTIKMAYSPELGPHWVAARDLPAGSVVISELPTFMIPCPSGVQGTESCMVCSCIFPAVQGHPCSKCQCLFCSNTCALARIHLDNECGIIRRARNGGMEMTVYVPQLGIHLNSYQMHLPFFRGVGIRANNPELWTSIMELAEEVKPPILGAPRIEGIKPFLPYLGTQIPEVEVPGFCKEMVQLEDILAKFSFSYDQETPADDTDNSNRTFWRNFYLKTSRISRQCFPNCFKKISPGPDYRMVIRTQTEVKEGQPLCLPHFFNFHLNFIGAAKTQHMLSGSDIICRCPRCLDPTELGTMMSAIKCGRCPGGYFLPLDPTDKVNAPWVCNGGCPDQLPWIGIQLMTDSMSKGVQKFSQKVSADDVASIQEFWDENLRKFLHPNHWITLQFEELMVGKLETFSYGSSVTAKRSDMQLEMLGHLLEMEKINAPGKSRFRRIYLEFLTSQRGQRLKTMERDPPSATTKKFIGESIKVIEECLEIHKIHPLDPIVFGGMTRCKDDLVYLYNL